MIRIYGEFEGDSSLCRVARGFSQVFPDAAQFELTKWGNDLDDSAPEQPGATSKIGIYVGGLSHIHASARSKHEKLYVMVAPNSNTVGALVRKKLSGVDRLLAPSRWAQGVLRVAFPEKEVLCVPHGVDPGFRRKQASRIPHFSVLHLSSSILERKGTDRLIEGWALAKLPDAKLLISVPAGRKEFFHDIASNFGLTPEEVSITDRLNYNVERMAALYSSVDYVCQPSRGEGFGLVPLEARACGTPVIATNCTGHSEHVRGVGVVVVNTGDDAPIDDFPGALAPSLSAADVAEALTKAYEKQALLLDDARASAEAIRKHWSWENQLKEFKNEVMH